MLLEYSRTEWIPELPALPPSTLRLQQPTHSRTPTPSSTPARTRHLVSCRRASHPHGSASDHGVTHPPTKRPTLNPNRLHASGTAGAAPSQALVVQHGAVGWPARCCKCPQDTLAVRCSFVFFDFRSVADRCPCALLDRRTSPATRWSFLVARRRSFKRSTSMIRTLSKQ